MKEAWDSLGTWFRERTSSPLYATFIVSVILWNWKFFYILFWQGEEKLNIPKIEYVQQNFLWIDGYWHHLLYFIGLPLLSTFVIIWWLPILSYYAHKKTTEFYFQRKSVYDQADLEYEQRKTNSLEREVKEKKKQKVAKTAIQKTLTQEEKWTEEFNSIKKTPLYTGLSQISNVLYSKSGKTHDWAGSNYIRIISPNVLAIAHSSGLISIAGLDHNEKIELTEKGKFFMANYLKESKI